MGVVGAVFGSRPGHRGRRRGRGHDAADWPTGRGGWRADQQEAGGHEAGDERESERPAHEPTSRESDDLRETPNSVTSTPAMNSRTSKTSSKGKVRMFRIGWWTANHHWKARIATTKVQYPRTSAAPESAIAFRSPFRDREERGGGRIEPPGSPARHEGAADADREEQSIPDELRRDEHHVRWEEHDVQDELHDEDQEEQAEDTAPSSTSCVLPLAARLGHLRTPTLRAPSRPVGVSAAVSPALSAPLPRAVLLRPAVQEEHDREDQDECHDADHDVFEDLGDLRGEPREPV